MDEIVSFYQDGVPLEVWLELSCRDDYDLCELTNLLIMCLSALEYFTYKIHMSLCFVYLLDKDLAHFPLDGQEVEEQRRVFLRASEDRR